MKERIFLLAGNLFLVNERIFLVMGNKFPATGKKSEFLVKNWL